VTTQAGAVLGSAAIAAVAVLLLAYLRQGDYPLAVASAVAGRSGFVQIAGRVVLTVLARRGIEDDSRHAGDHGGELVPAELLAFQFGKMLAEIGELLGRDDLAAGRKTTVSSRASCGSYIRTKACMAAVSWARVAALVMPGVAAWAKMNWVRTRLRAC
jgi:hypothetical protein